MKVLNLMPGMEISIPGFPSRPPAIFIARCNHPYYEGLQLVIWRLADGTISLDALNVMQDVGTAGESTPTERRDNLHRALFNEERQK